MDWITDDIAIGDYFEAQNPELLASEKIRSILGLTQALRGIDANSLGVDAISIVPIIDGAGNDPRQLREAVDSLEYLITHSPPVLVHCRAGRSRSPFVVAENLMKAKAISAQDALQEVTDKRDVFVVPELILALSAFE